MNIVFMGTPEFAVPTLKKLIENYNVKAVFTQPDRPKGRGKKLAFSEVKQVAVDAGIKVIQPEKLRKDEESIKLLKEINPDFIIVVAYGQILPKEVLDIPKYYCINLHASLLPKYRGAAPINWCIINGEKVSGNTTMLMAEGLDTGDILKQSSVEITENMTYGELHDILKEDGPQLMVDTIEALVKNEIVPERQKDELSCYSPMISKEMAAIDWNNDAEYINNRIRGFNPWPITFTSYKNSIMKVYTAEILGICKEAPGTIAKVDKAGILVAAKDKYLLIKEIQFPGGKRMRVEDYLKGNTIEEGIKLG